MSDFDAYTVVTFGLIALALALLFGGVLVVGLIISAVTLAGLGVSS